MCGLADGGERVDELGAGALAVRDEPRDVAPVDAAAGDEQVVAASARDAAQLHLARRGSCVGSCVGAGRSEPGVTLDALARGVELVALRLFVERAGLQKQVFDNAQGVNSRTLHLLHAPLVGCLMLGGVRLLRLYRGEPAEQAGQ